jgi:tetratricopeptide (TPR) repeat protein
MNMLLTASALVVSALDPEHSHEHSPQLGKLSFETTCSPAAQAAFERGLGWLHSFEYRRAEDSFSEAAAADPDCGIADWGVAMSYYHPLWDGPTPAEQEKGKNAIGKAKAAGARSQRERDYVAALETFYRESDRLDLKTRAFAYSAAMEQLHNRYPQDDEAAVFYALSLITTGTMDGDPSFPRQKHAGAILNQVLTKNPDHPGVAHYLIHSFDYPALAELALPAARRYAKIAPDSAHAQHMPSHIFTRLGLWDEAITSNRAAEAAARAYAKSSGMPGAWDQQLHAMDYLAYAYLQSARDAEAQQVLNELKTISQADPPTRTVAYAVTAIPARVALERRHWREAASLELPANLKGLSALTVHEWAVAHIYFARAVGAARSGDAGSAHAEVAKLSALEQALVIRPGEYDWRKQVSIERQIAEAWAAHAGGKDDEAVRLMRAAADLDDATEKNPVTPGSILPAREQLGEVLLDLGRPDEALKEYEASLQRAPRRLAGLYGAARSARLAGDTGKAGRYFAELAKMTERGDAARAEVKSARLFEASLARTDN